MEEIRVDERAYKRPRLSMCDDEADYAGDIRGAGGASWDDACGSFDDTHGKDKEDEENVRTFSRTSPHAHSRRWPPHEKKQQPTGFLSTSSKATLTREPTKAVAHGVLKASKGGRGSALTGLNANKGSTCSGGGGGRERATACKRPPKQESEEFSVAAANATTAVSKRGGTATVSLYSKSDSGCVETAFDLFTRYARPEAEQRVQAAAERAKREVPDWARSGSSPVGGAIRNGSSSSGGGSSSSSAASRVEVELTKAWRSLGPRQRANFGEMADRKALAKTKQLPQFSAYI